MKGAVSGRHGSVYNVGGGAITDRPLRIQREEAQKGDMRDTYADTTAARRDLGFESRVGLSEGLAREWEWLGERA